MLQRKEGERKEGLKEVVGLHVEKVDFVDLLSSTLLGRKLVEEPRLVRLTLDDRKLICREDE